MRKILYCIFCFFLLNLYSCKENPYPHYLLLADSLTLSYPDSAVALLKAVKSDIPHQSEATQRYYQLLCIKANDKAYIPLGSDSLIKEIVNYYLERKDKRHLYEAYLYAGRTYADLGDAPQALDYFFKSLDAMEERPYYKTRSLIHSQCGYLFRHQGLLKEADGAYRNAYRYSLLENDSVSMIYDLRDIADIYYETEKFDSALNYYQRSYDIAAASNNYSMMGLLQGYMVRVYSRCGDYDLAKDLLEKALVMRKSIYSIAADLYYKMGDMDSAIYFYDKVLLHGNLHAKNAAHWGLADITLKKGELQKAAEHIKHYMAGIDSVWAQIENEAVLRVNSLYNYSLRERENYRLKEERRQKQIYFYCVLALLLVIAVRFLIYYHYSRLERNELNLQIRQLKDLQEEQHQKTDLYIEENKREQETLEHSLQDASLTEAEKAQLLRKKQQLYYEGKTAELEVENRKMARQTLLQSDICKYFTDCIGKGTGVPVSSDKWLELENAVNGAFDNFMQRLMQIRKMSKYEMHLCLLLKIEVSPSDMAILTDHSRESVTSSRRRLYEKFFGESGTPQQWDDFIALL